MQQDFVFLTMEEEKALQEYHTHPTVLGLGVRVRITLWLRIGLGLGIRIWVRACAEGITANDFVSYRNHF